MASKEQPQLNLEQCRNDTSTLRSLFEANKEKRFALPTSKELLDKAYERVRDHTVLFLLDFDDTILAWPKEKEKREITAVTGLVNGVSSFYGRKGKDEENLDTLYGFVSGCKESTIIVMTFGVYTTANCVLRQCWGDDFVNTRCLILDRSVLDAKTWPPWIKENLKRIPQEEHDPYAKAALTESLLRKRKTDPATPKPLKRVVFADDNPDNADAMMETLKRLVEDEVVPAQMAHVMPAEDVCPTYEKEWCAPVNPEKARKAILGPLAGQSCDAPPRPTTSASAAAAALHRLGLA